LQTGGYVAEDIATQLEAIVAKRGAAYIRESSDEQGEGFSPGAQRKKIYDWAQENGIEIIGEYCDLHSAWRKSEARPEFQRLMSDAAKGMFDVVLVFHTSRFARNQSESRRYKQLLRERLNIQVISVSQPLGDDPSEPSSFLAESINEMFDEYYLVSLSFWTRSGLAEKARQGHLVGLLPWGYVRDEKTKLAVPHPWRAPLVPQMFERYDTGQESDRSLAAWLNAKGARTARGQKAELYAAYAASDAWRGRHLSLPALLFLTTTDARAAKFLSALARALSHGPRQHGRRAFVAGAAGITWAPGRLLGEACLADLDGNVGLTLTDTLSAARAPYEQALAYRQQQADAEEARRRELHDDPEAMLKFLADYAYALSAYTQALGATGERAVELLRASSSTPTQDEREALSAIARELNHALPESRANDLPSPSAAVREAIALLIEHYRATQSQQVKTLASRHGVGPSLRRAGDVLREDGLLDHALRSRLPDDAGHDAASRDEQHERQVAYLGWREQAARRLARGAGALGRLTHRAEDFYGQLDQERLRVCGRCGETIYPPARHTGSFDYADSPSCHYCREPHATKPYTPTSTTRTEARNTHEQRL
jgi:DNA invertase Pin-like site-specific DNA recombinase